MTTNPKQDNQDVVKATFITTNDFLMDGNCLECGTNITRYNSKLKNGVRTCICCGYESPNGWLAPKTIRREGSGGRILIIPDIHNKYDIAESIIHKENPDNIVFLGDYFDSFYDTLENTEQTAEWLKDSLQKENRIHLLGNHDLSYLNSNHHCSGFSEGKLFTIKKTSVDLTKLQHYCWVGDWLCTHAGLTRDFFSAHNHKNLFIGEFLDDMIENYEDRLYNCSNYRGGIDAHSGIVWCDYDEFVDIPNVKQIFGHTRGELRQTKNHVCLDTALQNYAIYDGELKIESV